MPRRIAYHRPPHLSPDRVRRQYDTLADRVQAKRFYASEAWRSLRAAFLRENPLCLDCKKAGRTTAAEHVHHIKDRRQHPELALEWTNLEPACLSCHNAKRKQR